MENTDKNILSGRLKLARKMAGMSLQGLSDKLEGLVSKQSLNKYEQGLMMPSDEMLNKISAALNLKPDYFFRKISIELNPVCFRKNISLTKSYEESIIEKARDYIERYSEIENILGIDINFKNPVNDLVIKNLEDAENAAKVLRKVWELGSQPIPQISKLLELKGVKVYRLDHNDNFDGASILTNNNIPVVVINIKDKSHERMRFTILHELGHILLNFDKNLQKTPKEIELLCHKFASCFLLPSNMLIDMIGGNYRNYISIKELISIKEFYGVSIRAILFRLRQMNIINETYYKRWSVYLSKTYGKKKEPGNFYEEEGVSCLEQLVNRALSEEIISISKAAYLLNVDIKSLRKVK